MSKWKSSFLYPGCITQNTIKMIVLFAWNDSDKPLDFAAYFIMALTITELMAVDDDN